MSKRNRSTGSADVRSEPYTGIRNTLLEAIAGSKLTGRACRTLLAILRLTLGWSQSSAKIPLKKLHEMTGIGISHISEALDELVEHGFIRRTRRSMYEVIFPSKGTSNFPSTGTSIPADGKKNFLPKGTHDADSAYLHEEKFDPKESNKETPQRKTDGDYAQREGEPTSDRLSALAVVIAAAHDAPFDTDTQHRAYLKRHHIALADLALYQSEDIAKAIMAEEAKAQRVGYAWTPTHVANAIDGARGHEIESDDAQERFDELLSFFQEQDYDNF